jgi:hypothetical protein
MRLSVVQGGRPPTDTTGPGFDRQLKIERVIA